MFTHLLTEPQFEKGCLFVFSQLCKVLSAVWDAAKLRPLVGVELAGTVADKRTVDASEYIEWFYIRVSRTEFGVPRWVCHEVGLPFGKRRGRSGLATRSLPEG